MDWAMDIGYRACMTREYGKTYTRPYFYGLAKSIAFDKMKETLGLDK